MALRRRLAEGADLGEEEDAATSFSLEEDTARLLQSKLAEFTGNSRGEPPSASLKRILDLASSLFLFPTENSVVCRHSCEHHENLMDPSLWGQLPQPLLFQVFARLPLPNLMSLQLLSRRWKTAFFIAADEDSSSSSSHSSFLTACEECHPVFALLTHTTSNTFCVRLLDVKLHAWHLYELQAGDARAVEVKAASQDGGLVCFVSSFLKHKTRTFLVDVVNPFTKQACALPPLKDLLLVEMAQIVVNRETQQYVVLVAGEGASGVKVIKLYDQSISVEKWVVPPKKQSRPPLWLRLVYGNGFHLGNFRYHQKRDGPSVYDMVAQRMHALRASRPNPLEPPSVKSFALVGDRVFVLSRDRANRSVYSEFYIVEFRLAFGTGQEWVKVRSHRCEPFVRAPQAKFEMALYACQGFLMVLAVLPEKEPFRREAGWVYDLATCQWSELPALPGEVPFHVDDLMCRMHWDVSV